MKNVLALVLLLASLPLGAAESAEEVAKRFIGDYELVSFVQFPLNREAVSNDYIGRLSYDAFGNMSGLGMPMDLPERAASSGGQARGGFAYWGTISIDPAEQKIIHHVKGSPTAPQWVGGDNVRYYEFEEGGDILKLSLRDDNGRTTATLTWRRLK